MVMQRREAEGPPGRVRKVRVEPTMAFCVTRMSSSALTMPAVSFSMVSVAFLVDLFTCGTCTSTLGIGNCGTCGTCGASTSSRASYG